MKVGKICLLTSIICFQSLGWCTLLLHFEKQRHQFDNYGIHIVFHRWLWTSDKPLKFMKVHVLVMWC
jgi:hypothetical protein